MDIPLSPPHVRPTHANYKHNPSKAQNSCRSVCRYLSHFDQSRSVITPRLSPNIAKILPQDITEALSLTLCLPKDKLKTFSSQSEYTALGNITCLSPSHYTQVMSRVWCVQEDSLRRGTGGEHECQVCVCVCVCVLLCGWGRGGGGVGKRDADTARMILY